MTIVSIERELNQLGRRLDEPFTSIGDPDDVCMALGRRGRELHRGYVRSVRRGHIVASRALLRPALETNILLRFIRQYPVERTRLWHAESQRFVVQLADESSRRPLPAGQRLDGLPSQEELVRFRREIASVRKAAQDAGVPGVTKNGPLIPPLRDQVQLIDTPETWQAYITAYMALNSEQHILHLSFQQSFRQDQPDGSVILLDRYEVRPAERELGSSLFASTLVIVSSWLDLGITDSAERLRAELVGI